MVAVFISYRRADTPYAAGRLKEALARLIGGADIYLDVDNNQSGDDFRTAIYSAIGRATHVLILIGPGWTPARLADADDYVRFELYTAAMTGKIVVPVLLEQALMPSPADLPTEFAFLPSVQAARLRNDPDFRTDLIQLAGRIVGGAVSAAPLQTQSTTPGPVVQQSATILPLIGSWQVGLATTNAKFLVGRWHFGQESRSTVDYLTRHNLQRAYDLHRALPRGPCVIDKANSSVLNSPGPEYMFWTVEAVTYDKVVYSQSVLIKSRHYRSAEVDTWTTPVTILEYELVGPDSIKGRARVNNRGIQSGALTMTRLGDAPDVDQM